MNFFDRFAHPRLVVLALAGGGWWVVGLAFVLFGSADVRGLSIFVHLAGLTLVVLAAVLFGVLWWVDVVRSRLSG